MGEAQNWTSGEPWDVSNLAAMPLPWDVSSLCEIAGEACSLNLGVKRLLNPLVVVLGPLDHLCFYGLETQIQAVVHESSREGKTKGTSSRKRRFRLKQ